MVPILELELQTGTIAIVRQERMIGWSRPLKKESDCYRVRVGSQPRRRHYAIIIMIALSQSSSTLRSPIVVPRGIYHSIIVPINWSIHLIGIRCSLAFDEDWFLGRRSAILSDSLWISINFVYCDNNENKWTEVRGERMCQVLQWLLGKT